MGIFVFPGKAGLWFWHLKAANGEILAHSEGYVSKQGAEHGANAAIQLIKRLY